MISNHIVVGFFFLGIAILALWPGARISRTVKALLRWLVRKPRIRLWLDLDPVAPPASLRGITDTVGEWTSKTFVAAGGLGACAHIGDETKELHEILTRVVTAQQMGEPVDPADMYELGLELADILILTIDIAYCRGVDLTDFVLLKHYINTRRIWGPPDERGVQHHIEPPIPGDVTRSEAEIQRLKRDWKYGSERLAAILAKPDAAIAGAMAEVLNENEPLGSGFKP